MVRSCIDRKITKKKTAKRDKTQVYNHKLHHKAARHVGHNVKDFFFFFNQSLIAAFLERIGKKSKLLRNINTQPLLISTTIR